MTEKFNKLILAARYFLLGKDFYKAAEALEFGAEHHTGVRKDGVTPEFQHQLEVFHCIRTVLPCVMYPEETLIVAILHDTKEDKGILSSVFTEKFGSRVSQAIDLLDKNGKDTQQVFDGIGGDPIASVVKGFDRTRNQGTMAGVFSVEKELGYIKETETFIIPMLKKARRKFPQQEPAYENVKHMLNCQIDMVKYRLK